MICVSIANESRRLAMADMLTAAHQGDLVEVRLDRFDKAPDFKELLAARRKPVILTCRRGKDGGDWHGSEEEILARSSVPTVAVGLGKPGVMLTILGKKIGAPWAYAALGRGLETYPGEPTVEDLETVYHYHSIGRTTPLIGVTGFDERATATVAGLNAALAHLNLPARCWPLAVGSPRLFRKIID